MNILKPRVVLVGIVSLSLLAASCSSDDDTSDTTAGEVAATAPAGGVTSTAGGTATTAGAATTDASATTDAPATTEGSDSTEAPADLDAELNASGATFPQTFYEEAIFEFTEENSDVTINYGGGGSGKGRQDLADQIVDFAGTDGIVKEADLATYKGGEILYFPTVVAPITVSFNVDGVDELELTPATIAKIFQTEITTWNDPAIVAENPDADLPDTTITVVHRSDSSGTTENFTKFLESSVGAEGGGIWKLGAASTVEWPASTAGGQGNGGVAQLLTSTNGSIGYVDLSDAVDADLTFAAIENKAGNFVEPTLEGASAAAAGAKINPDLTYTAIWADGDDAYPITAQTWIIAYVDQTDAAKGEALKAFLEYVLTDGQDLAPEVNYAPLPTELGEMALAQIDKLVIG